MSSRCCSPPESSPIGSSAYALGADELDHLVHPRRRLAARPSRQRDAPARAVEAESHEVDAADVRALVEVPPLRQVADRGVGAAGALAEHRRPAGRERQEPEDRLDERRLAGAVRAEDRDEVAVARGERDVLPDGASVHPHGGAVKLDRDARLGHRTLFASASRSAFSCRDCQDWNVAEAGDSVSVIVATGMPFFRAASVKRATSGVLFWLL